MAIARLRVDSHDPEESAEQLALVAPDVSFVPTDSGPFSTEASACALPGLGLLSISLGHGRVLSPRRPFYSLTIPVERSLEIRDMGRAAIFGPRTMHFLAPDRPFDLRAAEPGATLVANLDGALAERHLRAWSSTGKLPPLRTAIDLEVGPGSSLRGYLEFLWRELERADSSFGSGLIAAEMASNVASLVVAAIVDPAPSSKTDGAFYPEYDALRSAEEYLAAHLSVPVALPDVAEACGLSVRSLSRAFRMRHGTGPIGFLREQRFAAAHSALAAARGQLSVTAVALKYGFSHLGRFAIDYRRRYGQSPSKTLARH